jgi:hypothetical protein
MKVLAATANMYRVLLPDGKMGCVAARSVESVETSILQKTASVTRAVRETPLNNAATMGLIDPGEDFFVLAQFTEYWLVRTQTGLTGWMQVTS